MSGGRVLDGPVRGARPQGGLQELTFHAPEFQHSPTLSFTERELRWIMPFTVATDVLSWAHATTTVIHQHYFPRKHIEYLKYLIVDALDVTIAALDSSNLTSARIRRSIGDTERFTLELKSPKTGNETELLSRAEYSAEISEDRFKRLRKIATRGYLEKTRHTLEGTVSEFIGTRRITHRATLDIDLIHQAGMDAKRGDAPLYKEHNFAMLDLEVASAAALAAADVGQHSFRFLESEAVKISGLKRAVQSALSVKRIARDGIDSEARAVLKRLLH